MMDGARFQTFSGIWFDLLNPTVDMIDIHDIAHSLSQANRFTGHTRFPYPVSQHSRLGSYLVPEKYALLFLLHDASEAYVGDMSSPLKHHTPVGIEYGKIENPIQHVICDKFNLPHEKPNCIKLVDNEMAAMERRCLLGNYHENNFIVETSFFDNRAMFLDRFFELYKGKIKRAAR